MDDPVELLEQAWILEPWSRYAERTLLLDRLEHLVARGEVPPPPPGRDWRLELLAERAVNASGWLNRPEEAVRLADQVLTEADPTCRIAIGRAQLAAGQALAWTGTDAATARAELAFADAADQFRALDNREWLGSALLRWGYSVWFQSIGYLPRAKELIAEALETWDPGSHRLAASLGYYADVLIDLGELDDADRILDRAWTLASRVGIDKVLGEIADSRARVAAARGDARATERLLLEAEREASGHEWFDSHIGTSMLLDAAQLLDRVGLEEQAWDYYERGRARAGDDDPDVLQTLAARLARSGDPLEALDVLQRTVRQDWLEKRLVWRQLLLTAWATFRAGREGAGELAARALDHAVACGGVQIAQYGEPILSWSVAALAEEAGSVVAREMLLSGRPLLVRLFGTTSVTRADGTAVSLPGGKPVELVRMLALHESGLPVDMVIDHLFPDASLSVGRSRLRQVLHRLRSASGELVEREGDHLLLVPAWVDVREFLAASNRVRGTTGSLAVQRAYAALALATGPFLPSDRYATWADDVRKLVEYRFLELLELVTDNATRTGSYHEALTALDAAQAASPDRAERYSAIVEQLQALGRQRTAEYVAGLVVEDDVDDLLDRPAVSPFGPPADP